MFGDFHFLKRCQAGSVQISVSEELCFRNVFPPVMQQKQRQRYDWLIVRQAAGAKCLKVFADSSFPWCSFPCVFPSLLPSRKFTRQNSKVWVSPARTHFDCGDGCLLQGLRAPVWQETLIWWISRRFQIFMALQTPCETEAFAVWVLLSSFETGVPMGFPPHSKGLSHGFPIIFPWFSNFLHGILMVFVIVLSHFSMANSGGLHDEEIVKPRPMSPEEMLT